jgi:hypothetical protein
LRGNGNFNGNGTDNGTVNGNGNAAMERSIRGETNDENEIIVIFRKKELYTRSTE